MTKLLMIVFKNPILIGMLATGNSEALFRQKKHLTASAGQAPSARVGVYGVSKVFVKGGESGYWRRSFESLRWTPSQGSVAEVLCSLKLQ
jgi:hypothetical protein